MKIQDNKTLLFIGDSITDCGRNRPVGEHNGLGTGYVSLVNGLLQVMHPDRKIRVLNTGISGNRVSDLQNRWEEDVIMQEPHWLSIMIGINDVWRQFDNITAPFQITPDIYKATLSKLLAKTRPTVEGLVLMTPFYLENNTEDPMRKMMDEYGAIVKELADANDALFVDTQAAFNEFTAIRPTQSLCGDRVHPGLNGHLILARAFLNAIGTGF